MSNTTDEIPEATPKGQALVKYCAICGVEFDETVLTNRFFRCASCETIIQIKTKSGEWEQNEQVENSERFLSQNIQW